MSLGPCDSRSRGLSLDLTLLYGCLKNESSARASETRQTATGEIPREGTIPQSRPYVPSAVTTFAKGYMARSWNGCSRVQRLTSEMSLAEVHPPGRSGRCCCCPRTSGTSEPPHPGIAPQHAGIYRRLLSGTNTALRDKRLPWPQSILEDETRECQVHAPGE